MKSWRSLYIAVFILMGIILLPSLTLACNCPTGQTWNGTKCVPNPPPPTPTPTPTNNNTNTNNNANNNNNQQQQGQTQGQQQGQSQVAQGGNSSATGGNNALTNSGNSSSTSTSGVNNSGNSSVGPITNSATGGSLKDSGNSSNTNTNTSSSNANQSQSNSSTNSNASSASASNNGNGSNNSSYTNNTNIAAPKIPVSTAYAPPAIATAPCMGAVSGGFQLSQIGLSGGASKAAKNCEALEVARSFDAVGERIAACKVKINTKYAKEAGVTLQDCLNMEQPQEPPVVVQPQPSTQPTIIVNVPAPVVNNVPATTTVTPVQEVKPAPVRQLMGVCSFSQGITCGSCTGHISMAPGTACQRMLDSAVLALSKNPSATLEIVGAGTADNVVTASRVNNTIRYLTQHGVSIARINTRANVGQTSGTVEIWVVQ